MQILTKELQIVRQQFLLSESFKDSSDSELNSVKYQFVAMSSVSPYQNYSDRTLITSLQSSFRCLELLKPDIKIISSMMLTKEGFQNVRSLSDSLCVLIKSLSEKIDPRISVSAKAIMNIVNMARRMINDSEPDLEQREVMAVTNATRLYFLNRLISGNILGEITKEKVKEMQDSIDDVVGTTFRKRQKIPFDVPDLREGLEKSAIELNMKVDESQIKLCEDLYYGLRINRGIILAGPATSGKSSCLNLLAHTLNGKFETHLRKATINPNILSKTQLFGSKSLKKNQKEGLLARMCEEDGQCTNWWLVLESRSIKSW